eukprot:10963289-Ditylum_brightwellii.AAC.1
MVIISSSGDNQPVVQQIHLQQLGNNTQQPSLHDCKRSTGFCVSGNSRSAGKAGGGSSGSSSTPHKINNDVLQLFLHDFQKSTNPYVSGKISTKRKDLFGCDTSAGSCCSEICRSATKTSAGSSGSIFIVGSDSHNNQK